MDSKKYVPTFLVITFYTISSVLLIYFALFPANDLLLSGHLKNVDHSFGVFFEFFGFWPYRLGIMLSSSTLIFHRQDVENKRVSTTLLLLGLFGMISQAFIFSSSVFYYISGYLGVDLLIPHIFVLKATMLVLAITFGKKVNPKHIQVLRLLGVALVFYLFFNLLVCDSLKLIWGRVRPHTLTEYLEFSSWHLPQGVSGHKAFPSAHAMHGCVLFIISYILFKFDPRWENRGKVLLSISIIWSLCVAFSRIVVGAHYPSDITAGLMLGVTGVLLSIMMATRFSKILEFRPLPFIMLLVGVGSLLSNIFFGS